MAERQALAVAERSPGQSEARKLAADAVYGAAVEAFDHGDYGIASLGLERATMLYAAACELGRSDASLHEAAAQAWLQRAEAEYRQGRSPRESLEQALDIIDNHALRADPDDAQGYTLKSYVLLGSYRLSPRTGSGDQRSRSPRKMHKRGPRSAMRTSTVAATSSTSATRRTRRLPG